MVRGFLYLVLVLLGIGAVAAVLRDEEGSDLGSSDGPGAEPAAVGPGTADGAGGGAPSLVARGGAVDGARPRGSSVPPAIFQAALDQGKPGHIERLAAWLEEDPSRLLDLVAAYGQHVDGMFPKDGMPDRLDRVVARTAGWTRRLILGWGSRLPDLRVTVRGALRTPGHSPALLGGLLGVFSAKPVPAEGMPPVLRTLVGDESQPASVRLLAARALLALGGTVATDDRAMVALVEANLLLAGGTLTALVSSLKARGSEAREIIPGLVRIMRAGGGGYGARLRLLEALLAIDSTHPQVQALLPELVTAHHRGLRKRARALVFGGDVRQVLARLETMPSSARIEGVAVLLQRGVEAEALHSHVLAMLASKGASVRKRALAMLGKVGPDVADVMPILTDHLASEDRRRWLTAVEALGTLSMLPGNRDPAIQRLFAVTRSPDARVRKLAVQSILMHAAKPEAVIEILRTLVGDTEAAVRREAADGLGDLVAEHPAARRALEAARNDTDADVRELVAYWLDDDEEAEEAPQDGR